MSILKSINVLLLAVYATAKEDQDKSSQKEKCRILSFHGGGIHGSFEAGVLKALMEHMPTEEVKYDIISGVSIGAINAAVFALYPKGEEKEAAELIMSQYEGKSSTDSAIIKKHPTWSALRTPSFADNKRL